MEEPSQIPRDDLTELPLFPLNLVLFPGMRLPLHIFEERYKTMIGDCLERKAPFGILLIKEGQEVGEPAEPFRVGTTARIARVQHLEEGRMNILTHGERRFELVEIIHWAPHMVGLVKYLEDEIGDIPASLITEIQDEYATFLRHLATLAGGWNSHVEVTQDPMELASEVVPSLSANVELPAEVRQQLLETPTVGERLERLLPLLKRGNEMMRQKVEENNPFRGYRLN